MHSISHAAASLDSDDAAEVAGRAGLVSQGVIWIVTGLLALRLAFQGHSKPGDEPDKRGALQLVARQPFGRALLVILLVGFIAMVVWSAFEAFRKRDGERTGHWAHRGAAGGRALVYVALAASTVPVVFGKQSDGGGQEQFTARALGWPGGRVLVGAVALALFGIAGANLYRVVSRKYEERWKRGLTKDQKRTAAALEIAGNTGHAMVFALVGWFILMAAWRFDSSEPKSLDESLHALVLHPNGRVWCLVVAAGMIAWGLNALGESRWREVPARDR